jgi:prolyl-tRNA synthetase
MQLPGRDMDTKTEAEKLYSNLKSVGISVLFDDRAERAGVKFNDADLIGIPLRVTVGEKNLKAGMVELKMRKAIENQIVQSTEIIRTIQSMLKTLQ